jgi:hypothetical protein
VRFPIIRRHSIVLAEFLLNVIILCCFPLSFRPCLCWPQQDLPSDGQLDQKSAQPLLMLILPREVSRKLSNGLHCSFSQYGSFPRRVGGRIPWSYSHWGRASCHRDCPSLSLQQRPGGFVPVGRKPQKQRHRFRDLQILGQSLSLVLSPILAVRSTGCLPARS